MPPVGFAPTIAELKRAKTAHASERAATVLGTAYATLTKNNLEVASALRSDIFTERLLLLHSNGSFVELFCANSPLQELKN
jgi:hypothetical protein